jgi:hypothetical protein
MNAIFTTALLASTGLAVKHSLMSYDKINSDHYTIEIDDEGNAYRKGWYTRSSNDVYI